VGERPAVDPRAAEEPPAPALARRCLDLALAPLSPRHAVAAEVSGVVRLDGAPPPSPALTVTAEATVPERGEVRVELVLRSR
jgi:hypothetical protein